MARRCKYCYSILNEQDSICSICKIDSNKDKQEMLKEEKKFPIIAEFCT